MNVIYLLSPKDILQIYIQAYDMTSKLAGGMALILTGQGMSKKVQEFIYLYPNYIFRQTNYTQVSKSMPLYQNIPENV